MYIGFDILLLLLLKSYVFQFDKCIFQFDRCNMKLLHRKTAMQMDVYG